MDKARLKIGSVPVRIAARVYGRDPAWVRAGIIAGGFRSARQRGMESVLRMFSR